MTSVELIIYRKRFNDYYVRLHGGKGISLASVESVILFIQTFERYIPDQPIVLEHPDANTTLVYRQNGTVTRLVLPVSQVSQAVTDALLGTLGAYVIEDTQKIAS